MNYFALSDDELIRYADPKTPLEIELFDRIKRGIIAFDGDNELKEKQIESLEEDNENLSGRVSDYESNFDEIKLKCQDFDDDFAGDMIRGKDAREVIKQIFELADY